jgi:type IV pilus assembly protein PilY1
LAISFRLEKFRMRISLTRRIKKSIAWHPLCLGIVLGYSASAGAVLPVPNTPIFLANDVAANIFFALDDSGSMDWEVTQSNGARVAHVFSPDSGNLDFSPNETTEDREHCAGYNVLAYDPNVSYRPWFGNDNAGVAYANQAIGSARRDPYQANGWNYNLLNADGGGPTGYGLWVDGFGTSPADDIYQNGECPVSTIASGLYSDRGRGYTDARWIFVNTLTAAQQTNYANWYSYYRKREYVLKRSISELITNSTQRMGLATLHNNNAVGTPVAEMTVASNKATLLTNLSRINSTGGTPLRALLQNTGEYFDGTDGGNNLHSPLGFTSSSPILAQADGGECQQNFAVLFSDGFWNGAAPTVGNTDIDGAGAWDGGPHADAVANTLADVAMLYYEKDLSALANNVPVITNVDENSAQHLVTYTVAFGLNGSLTSEPANHNAATPAPPWPTPAANALTTIDDMRHAAFNSRGLYLAGQNPTQLIDSLNSVLADIGNRTGSASAVAATSQSIQTGTLIFQGFFDTENWDGDLFALEFLDGGIIGATVWNASDGVPVESSRNIFTWVNDDTTKGAEFEWANLTTAQQTLIGSQAIVDYVRGDRSAEVGNGGAFRDRDELLGDIVHSTPVAVTSEQSTPPYQSLSGAEGSSYNAFLQGRQSRLDMVYVGANDGMLHGIRTDTGVEQFGYVPQIVFGNLAALTSPAYAHQFYVDGALQIADAYIGGYWKTVLLGATGRGGAGIFALDVSAPASFTGNDVLWEFTHADLGLVLGKMQIVRLQNDAWAAVLGNGYNSGTERAQLFIIDLASGTLLRKFDTGVGSELRPNGMATPLLVDTNADFSYEYAYAGDLRGNLWKFDLTDTNPANWSIALSGSPLYTAIAPTGSAQAITTKPAIIVHPNGGFVILFGTGRFFVTGDDIVANPAAVDTFYGIRDSGVAVKSVGERVLPGGGTQPTTVLQSQEIIEEDHDLFGVLDQFTRTLSQNNVDYATQKGWYLDFVSPVSGAIGERVIADPLVEITEGNEPLVIFNTFAPNGGCQDAGGFSALMAFDPLNGGRTDFAVFDLNGDDDFTTADAQSDGSGGFDHDNGWIGTSTVAPVTIISSSDGTVNHAVTAGLDGSTDVNNVNGAAQSLGRQSWRQLQ